eukprot:Hpha_TRINITY_DN16448_c3_g3::TRINITY_DN16448_c3_g3_i1::g.159643::m.159643
MGADKPFLETNAEDKHKHLMCPITNELFRDPVLCNGDGHTYERAAIEKWLATGNRKSPMTGVEMDVVTLVPNFQARAQADDVRGHEVGNRISALPGAAAAAPKASSKASPKVVSAKKCCAVQPGYEARPPGSSMDAPGAAAWSSPEKRIDAHALAGDWCCTNPLGQGCSRITAINGDTIESFGCCLWLGPGGLCVGGEVRTRIPNSNRFRHHKDHNNVTSFNTANCGCNCWSLMCKCPWSRWHALDGVSWERQVPPKYQWKKITAYDIAKGTPVHGEGVSHSASHWCCGCWCIPCGLAKFTKAASSGDEDTLLHKGVCCFDGIICPFEEKRHRLYVGSIPTNGFYKEGDKGNVDWFATPGCVGNGASCSFRC